MVWKQAASLILMGVSHSRSRALLALVSASLALACGGSLESPPSALSAGAGGTPAAAGAPDVLAGRAGAGATAGNSGGAAGQGGASSAGEGGAAGAEGEACALPGEQPGDSQIVVPASLDALEFSIPEDCSGIVFSWCTKSSSGECTLRRCPFTGCTDGGENAPVVQSSHVLRGLATRGDRTYFGANKTKLYRLSPQSMTPKLLGYNKGNTLGGTFAWGDDVLFRSYLGEAAGHYGLLSVSPSDQIDLLYSWGDSFVDGVVAARDASTLFILDGAQADAKQLIRLDRSSGQLAVSKFDVVVTPEVPLFWIDRILALPGGIFGVGTVDIFHVSNSDLTTWTTLPQTFTQGLSGHLTRAHGRVYDIRYLEDASHLVYCSIEEMDSGHCEWKTLGSPLSVGPNTIHGLAHDASHVYVLYGTPEGRVVKRFAK